MSIGLYTHTTRATGTTLTSTIYNGDHVNHITNQNPQGTGAYSDSVPQMQLVTDPGEVGTESLAASLAGEIERLRFAIKDIKTTLGLTSAQWYSTPTGTMALTNPSNASQALTDAATITWDASLGAVATVTIAGNRTLAAPTNLKVGGQYILIVTQDATGGRTLTWNAAFKGTGGAAMSQPTAFLNSVSIFLFESDGTSLFLTGMTDLTNPGNTDQTLTDAATIAWNMNLGGIGTVTLGGNRTLGAPTNLKKGFYALHAIQDGTGSRTLSYDAAFKFPLGVAPVLSTPAASHDVLMFLSDGVSLYGFATLLASNAGVVINPISLFKRGALAMAQNQTFYGQSLGKAATGVEAPGETYVWEPMTLSELRAVASAAIPASNSVVFTVRKNGADTALTCTIGAAATAASDVTHSVDFGQGDRFSIKIVASATAGTNDYKAIVRAVKIRTSIGLPSFSFSSDADIGNGGDGANYISYGEATGNFNRRGLSITKVGIPMPPAFVSPTLKVIDGGGTAQFYRNEVIMPALYFFPGQTTPAAPTDAARYLLAEMDRIAFVEAPGGTGGIYNTLLKFAGIGSNAYDPCPIVFSSPEQAQATTTYMGGYGGVANATENKVQIAMPACTVKNLRVYTETTPAAGQTITLTLRKNGVDQATTCQITNVGGRGASDLTNAVTFAAGDLLSIKCVSSATVGTRSLNASAEVFV